MTTTVIKTATQHALRAPGRAVRVSGRVAVTGVRAGIRAARDFPELRELPEGRLLDLPGRGVAFVVDTGAPAPGAPTLLLLHGLATTGYLNWFTTLDELRTTYRVVVLDQRWHGRGIVSDRFVLAECADDAVAVLDALGVERAIVAGYSMGGALAQVFWHRHRERTAGLVLASTLARWKTNIGDELFYPVLGVANARLRGHYRRRVSAVREGLPSVPVHSDDMSAWAWTEFRSTSVWALLEVLGALGNFDARDWIGEIDVPTAVVVTARDRVLPTARQRQMAALIPDATVHEAPGGHASVVFDVENWLPVFLAAVEDVRARALTPAG